MKKIKPEYIKHLKRVIKQNGIRFSSVTELRNHLEKSNKSIKKIKKQNKNKTTKKNNKRLK